MGRRALVGIVLAWSLAACGAGADHGRGAPVVAEPVPVDDLGALAGPIWVPISVGGEAVYNRGSYWEIVPDPAAAEAWTIAGAQSCNQFGLDARPALEDGAWTGFEVWTTAAGCGHEDAAVLPVAGMRLTRDGDALVAVGEWPGRGRAEARFLAADAPPPVPLAPPPTIDPGPAQDAAAAERQAAIDAQAARRSVVRTELDAARARWVALGLTTYHLAFEAGCLECPTFPTRRSWSREWEITVVDGVADSPWTDASVGATVDAWFAFLDAHLDTAWSLDAEFDPGTGAPVWMEVTNQEYGAPGPEPFETFVIQAVTVTPI